MHFVDVDPQRVQKKPDQISVLLKSGNFVESDFVIHHVELRLYKERIDQNLGIYSLITLFVSTDKGSIEMIYEEGFYNDNILERITKFIVSNLGLASLILRSTISLKYHMNNS